MGKKRAFTPLEGSRLAGTQIRISNRVSSVRDQGSHEVNKRFLTGFTLIELLVVIAIIAVLMAILIPSLERAREHAKRSVCKSNMKSICTAIIAFADTNNDLVPPLRLVSGNFNYVKAYNHETRWFRTGSSDYWNLGFLWRDGYIRQGEVFYCPSSRYFRYKDYNYNPAGVPPNTPFPQNLQPSATAGLGVRVPYIYNPICKLGPTGTNNTEQKFKKIYDFKSANTLVLVDILEGGVPAHISGWNVARGDMSIRFVIDKTIVDDLGCTDLIGQNFACWDRIMEKMLQR